MTILSGCQTYARDFEQVSDNEKIIIRFSHVVGEDTPKGQAARKFAQLVKDKSNGKIEVQVFANGSLYRDGEEWDALQAGKIQMIAPAMSKLISKVPDLQVFDLPFFFKNLDQVHQLTDGDFGKEIFQTARSNDVEPLAVWDNGFKQFTSVNHPLNKPEDFKGLIFRIMPSPVLERQFQLLDAKAEVRNFNEVYQSIVNKEIDGEENTISNIYTKKFYDVQDYLTISNHGYLGYLVMVNKEFWDGLSTENKKILSSTMKEVTVWERNMAEELQQKQLQSIKESKKININVMSDQEWEEFREVYQPLYQEIIQNLNDSVTTEMKALLK